MGRRCIPYVTRVLPNVSPRMTKFEILQEPNQAGAPLTVWFPTVRKKNTGPQLKCFCSKSNGAEKPQKWANPKLFSVSQRSSALLFPALLRTVPPR